MGRPAPAEGKQFAYSTMTLKSVSADGEKRRFTGIATTPSPDYADDIVVAEGAVYKLPLPLLAAHDSTQPIGWVMAARVSAKGIEVDCEVHDEQTPGALKDRLDEQWQSIKAGLVRGLSIGFRGIEVAQIEGSWGVKFLKWSWMELSTCVVACNSDASITAIKSADAAARAALGLTRKGVVRLVDPPPGASGNTSAQPAPRGLFVASTTPEGNEMKTIAERIAEFKARKAENLKTLQGIVDKTLESGETLDAEAKQKQAALRDENVTIDEHVAMLETHEKDMLASAKEFTPENTTPAARGTSVDRPNAAIVAVKSNLPKGTGLTRIAMAIGHSKGNLQQAANIAKRWTDTPQIAQVMQAMSDFGSSQFTKTAVLAGDSNTSGWASQLVYYADMASEFIELLRPKTIIGRMPGLRRVPFNIRFGSTLTGSSSAWVGETNPIPASALAFSSGTLGHAKAASLVVITKELAAFSNPAAEALVRDDMMGSMTQFLDAQFIDPAVAASANVSPASITNGLTPIASSGSTVAAIYTDVQALMTTFDVAELDTSDCVWVMKPGTARALSMKRTSQDIAIFPDIKQSGGEWFGLPVITSNSVPGSVSGGSIIVLVKASEVFFADDGGITLDVSEEASVQMLTNPITGAASLVSLFQNGLVGLRAVREINWQRRRTASVGYIDGVAY